MALGISILSYAGKVYLGVNTDTGLVPNPDEIINYFYEEFEALLDLVRQIEEEAAAKAPITAQININLASAADLDVLPGICRTMAERIVAYREENGRFTTVQDLTHVTGINESKLALIKDHITI